MLMDNALVDQEIGNYDSICNLEAEMLQIEQINIDTDHEFCNGLYCRTISIPADAVIVGAQHKHESFFIVRSRAIVIVGPSGPETYSAGHVGVSPAGIKRAIYAIDDSVFTTMHANPENETDLTKIWEKLVYDDLTKSIDLEKRKLLEKT